MPVKLPSIVLFLAESCFSWVSLGWVLKVFYFILNIFLYSCLWYSQNLFFCKVSGNILTLISKFNTWVFWWFCCCFVNLTKDIKVFLNFVIFWSIMSFLNWVHFLDEQCPWVVWQSPLFVGLHCRISWTFVILTHFLMQP